MGLSERRKREKENRKNIILKAARKLFFDKGFRDVTVDSIAKRAELSKGSIYLYFNSKEEIYGQILLNDIEKFHRKITSLVRNGESAARVLMDLSNTYLDFFLGDRELFRILMTFQLHTEHMNLSEGLHTHIIRTTNKTINIIETVLQHGVDTGEFPPTLKRRQIRNAIWGLLNGIISLHLYTGSEAKREEIIRSTVNESMTTFLRGLQKDAQ